MKYIFVTGGVVSSLGKGLTAAALGALLDRAFGGLPARAAPLTGLPEETIISLARRYGRAKAAFLRINYGLQRHGGGGMAVRTIACLPAVTGHWRRPGGGIQLSTSKAFQFNKQALGRPDFMPGPCRTINMIRLGDALNLPDAGVGGPLAFVEQDTIENWQRQYEINLRSIMLGAKHAMPHLRASAPASIINISSIAGLAAAPGMGAYNATKAAVWMYTKTLALEAAKADWNVRCNSVHPVFIKTPILDPFIAMAGGDEDKAHERLARGIPLKRIGDPDDVAYCVLYLASDESAFMTGTDLLLDGGVVAWCSLSGATMPALAEPPLLGGAVEHAVENRVQVVVLRRGRWHLADGQNRHPPCSVQAKMPVTSPSHDDRRLTRKGRPPAHRRGAARSLSVGGKIRRGGEGARRARDN